MVNNHLSMPQSMARHESAAQVLGSKGSSGSGDNYGQPMSSL